MKNPIIVAVNNLSINSISLRNGRHYVDWIRSSGLFYL